MPFFFILLLVGPVYGGAYAGVYLYYGPEVAKDALYPDYLYQTYDALWNYWMDNSAQVSWIKFVIPAFGPLALGFIGSIVLMWLFVKYIRGIFTVS
ncbi:MAG: hypothetical protein U1E36_08300 [Rickettsiales bacterium]